MYFPCVRHYQRYEYIVNKGYTYAKEVVDVGCGVYPLGSYLLAEKAKIVFAVDPLARSLGDIDKVVVVKEDVFDFCKVVDVITAVEVIEHIWDSPRFINHISRLCEYAFITTPLADYTHNTRNINHILEYSADDFNKLVEKGFTILDKVYQDGNLNILDSASPSGDSLDCSHIVQMVWCRSKYGKHK